MPPLLLMRLSLLDTMRLAAVELWLLALAACTAEMAALLSTPLIWVANPGPLLDLLPNVADDDWACSDRRVPECVRPGLGAPALPAAPHQLLRRLLLSRFSNLRLSSPRGPAGSAPDESSSPVHTEAPAGRRDAAAGLAAPTRWGCFWCCLIGSLGEVRSAWSRRDAAALGPPVQDPRLYGAVPLLRLPCCGLGLLIEVDPVRFVMVRLRPELLASRLELREVQGDGGAEPMGLLPVLWTDRCSLGGNLLLVDPGHDGGALPREPERDGLGRGDIRGDCSLLLSAVASELKLCSSCSTPVLEYLCWGR